MSLINATAFGESLKGRTVLQMFTVASATGEIIKRFFEQNLTFSAAG